MKDGALDFIQKPFTRGAFWIGVEKSITGFSCDSNTVHMQKISSLNFPVRAPLTRRERDVLQLAATGSSNKQIGEMLGISHRAVEEHRSKIMHKLGVKNIAELLIAVLK